MQTQDRYKTILVIVTGLLAFAEIFEKPVVTNIALIIAALTLCFEAAAKIVVGSWYRLAAMLGWVNSRILLSIIFFLVLVPMAWFSRWTRKDSLKLKRYHAGSVFDTRNYRYSKKDLENIW